MKYFRALAIFFVLLMPLSAHAGTFEVSGWIPYWRTATGTADVLPHLDSLTEINPFVYTIKSDGTLLDNGFLNEEPWKSFVIEAKRKKVRVIPTIMTSNGDLLHTLLSNQKTRIAFEDRITKLVKDEGYDGIDIDFEGKRAEDKAYFATFLKGLYMRMGKKWVMCTIESRTPLDSRYYGTTIPADAEIYANDFVAINKYCDRVRIMAYDQQGIDQKLASTAASSSQLYAPLADPAWVEKVVNLAAKDIKRSKIMIGVPTYGYEYAVTAYANNEYLYDILWSFNPGYALQIAQQYNIAPTRSPLSGEMTLTYTPNDSAVPPNTAPVPSNAAVGSPQASAASVVEPVAPMSGLVAAAAASLYATTYNSHLGFRMLDWVDASAVQQKIDLAKKLGVRGISIFKFDGSQDPAIWNTLQGVKR
ncbi:hypothetical protein HZC00_05665 [Candidatus Kaiserbacteria bacterium]|nr:hypothetical protein [Candidatus Kaiserbacteria bacterium]